MHKTHYTYINPNANHATPEGHKDDEDDDVGTSPILYRIGKLRFLIGIL